MIPIGTDLTQYAFGPAQSFFAAQPGVPTYISPLAPPPLAASPLSNPAEARALDALSANLGVSSPTEGSNTGGMNGAPNAGGFNSSRGLGSIGGMIGGALGPVGSAAGRGIGSAIGAAVDASRANSIAAELGLGPVADPMGAGARAAGRSAAQSATGFGLGALGLGPLGGLANRGLGAVMDSLFGTERGHMQSISNAIDAAIADIDDPAARDDARMGRMARAQAMADAPMADVAFGAHPEGVGVGVGPGGEAAGAAGGTAADGIGGGGRGGSSDSESAGWASGGLVQLAEGGKIVRGPGGGLDDLIPTTIDGQRAAALSDGEFVIPADVVSMMGDGSSNAGSQRLYDLVRSIREAKTGTSEQAGPLPVGDILKRISAR